MLFDVGLLKLQLISGEYRIHYIQQTSQTEIFLRMSIIWKSLPER